MSLLPTLLVGAGGGGGGTSSTIGTLLTQAVAASTTALTATYANGTLGVGATLTNAGTQAAFALDGRSPTVGQRVLIKNQAAPAQNGTYLVSVIGDASHNWVLTRSSDFDQAAEMLAGTVIEVTAGTVNAGTVWELFSTVATVGTTAVTFIFINITTKVDQNGSPIYGADSGAADAYVITLNPAPVAYTTGMVIRFKASAANATTTPTINVNSLGAKTIVKRVNTAMAANDILASQFVELIYDGTNFVMWSQFGNTAGGSGVTSVSGTANQIDSTGGATPVLSLSATIVTPGSLGVTSLTASRAVATDASKVLVSSATTDTELGYVAGVTSSIQTQINAISAGTSSNTKTITQTAHGFSVDQALYLVGTTYTLAIATSVAAAEVVGVVSSVTNVNTFVITTSGYITGLSSKTAAVTYFLSDATPGLITATEPTTPGNIEKPLYTADSTTSAYMTNFRGKVIPTPFSSIVTSVVGTANQIDVAGTTNPVLSLSATVVTPGSVAVTSLTASRAVATDGSKVLVSSATTDTELGYLSGVTSALQTQLNAKGTVTSVATGNGLRGGAITTTGTVNLNLNGTCGFRLSLTTATPVTTANVTGATTIYCVPYKGNEIALYSGSSSLWTYYQSAQLSIAVPNTANTAYDVFIYDNSGTPTLELTAWSNSGIGTGARATALVYQDGVLVKSGVLTRRYLGSFVTTSTLGQTEDSATNRFLWNYYHRLPRQFIRTETAVSWTYGTTTVRQANANVLNQVNFFIGVSEDVVSANVVSFCTANGTNPQADIGLTLDSITVHSFTNATWQQAIMATGSLISVALNATYNGYPGIGQHYLAWVESTGGTSATFYGYIGGTGADTYKNGIMGSILA